MVVPIVYVTDAVIGKACLPNVTFPLQLAASLKGKATFDELDGTLKRYLRAQKKVNVVRHDGEIVQPDLRQIAFQRLQEKARPSLIAKEALAARCLKADEVGLVCLPEDLSRGPHPFPPGLKPLVFPETDYGGAEAPPLQSESIVLQ